MQYNVQWLEKKNDDWIVVQLVESATNGIPLEYKDVSINRVNKKNETFPNFDDIQNGGTVEGELWKSEKGRYYLFAPKVRATGSTGAYKAQQIEKTMARKEESIEKFQDSKEQGIAISGAQRDAVLIVTMLFNSQNLPPEEEIDKQQIKEEIIKWRNWFLSSDFKDTPPF